MNNLITRKSFLKGAAAGAASLAALGMFQGVGALETATETSAETSEVKAFENGFASAKDTGDLVQAADGTYSTSALGRGGYLYVETVIRDGKINSVKVREDHLETALIASYAIPAMEEAIPAYNSYAVDTVAGCTFTCGAIMTAVYKAIQEAGGSPALYSNKPEAEVPADEEISCDLCVIGAGISGVAAAAKAAADGARVVLLEKSIFLGGCSLHSSGATAYGTQAARDAGEDSDTLIRARFDEWINYQHYRVDAGLLYTYLSNAGRALDFLNQSGELLPNAPTNYRLPTYLLRMPILEGLLEDTVIASGGEVRTCVIAKSLIQDADGSICGVYAETREGAQLTVRAKAVIISSGGYGGDTERVFKNSGVRAVSGAICSNIGEGIDMAYAVGARVPANISGLQLHQTLATAKLEGYDYFHTRMPMILCYSPSLLHVDKAGIRFRNEYYIKSPTAAAGCAAFTGDCTYVLVAQSTIDQLESGGMEAMGTDYTPGLPPLYKPDFDYQTVWTDVKPVLDDMVGNGWGYYGETIEALAENAGFDPATFASAFETYQGYCRDGLDAYFAKPEQYLVEYGYGPYYLVESTYNQLGTVTGLEVNSSLQVLDVNSRVIPGLYAVGADASSTLYDRMYSGSGDALAWAMTSGFLAGENAAKAIL